MTSASEVRERPAPRDTDRARRWTARPGLVLWLLAGTIAVGGALRFAGILWGLPQQLHADEWVIVEYAIDLARRNSFEPAFFARPDHLEIQASYIAYQLFAHLVHHTTPEDLFELTQAPFYAISRGITALFGTLMIPVAFLIGRLFAPAAALLMSVATALFPPFVEHSRYATPDIPLALTVMVVILGCALYVAQPTWPRLVLACAGLALGVTVKYPALVGAVAIAAVIVIAAVRRRRPLEIVTRGFAAAGLTLGMTFFLSPVLFTNASEVVHQLTAQNSDGHLGASGLGWWGNLLFYARSALESGGIILLAFAAVGIVFAILRRRWETIPLALGFVFWVAISALSLHWERWATPMYVSLVLFAGLGVFGAWTWVTASARHGRAGRIVVAVLASVSAVSLLVGALAHVAVGLAPDTRSAAARELDARGVDADNTVYDGYTPFRTDGPGTIAAELEVVDGELVARADDLGIEYVLTSSSMVGRYLADPSRPEHEVYAMLRDGATPLAQWDSVGSPPASAFEPVRIVQSVGYIQRLIAGGLTGPQLLLYRFPIE